MVKRKIYGFPPPSKMIDVDDGVAAVGYKLPSTPPLLILNRRTPLLGMENISRGVLLKQQVIWRVEFTSFWLDSTIYLNVCVYEWYLTGIMDIIIRAGMVWASFPLLRRYCVVIMHETAFFRMSGKTPILEYRGLFYEKIW